MNDDRARDLAAQAEAAGGLTTSLPGYPDTWIAWAPPDPAFAHQAITISFETEAGERFPFTWWRALLSGDDIPDARILIHARRDLGPYDVEIILHTSGPGHISGVGSSAPLGDVERLIERYHALVRHQASGDPFPVRRKRRGWAGAPDAIEQAVAAYRAIEEEYEAEDEDRRVTDQDVIDRLYTSRKTFYARLGDDGLRFDDLRRMAREEYAKGNK